MEPSACPRRPLTLLPVFGYLVVSALALVFSVGSVAIVSDAARLDGMRIGRATAVLASAIEPVRTRSPAAWTSTEQERVSAGFVLAMAEARESVQALEWVEAFAGRVALPERAAAAKAVRCKLEQHESAWLSIPRKITRAVLVVPARASAC